MRQDLIKLIEDQGDVSNAIILTHNIDFVFLQTIVLPALKHCGRPKLTVFADAQCAANSYADQAPVLNTLGTRYRVVPVAMEPGFCFHPKALLLAGPDKVTLLVGSGNLTYGGWRKHAEVWVGFDSDKDTTAPFTAFRNYLVAILARVPLSGPIMDEIEETFDGLNHPWAQSMDPPSGLLGRVGNAPSLLEQIIQISGEGPVQQLTVCSPYFDANGIALTDLINRLKAVKTDVLIEKRFPKLSRAVVAGLPPHVEIIPIGFTQKDVNGIERESFIHAKFYGISDGTRTLVIAGSANCSQAALTIPGKDGNAELLAVQSLSAEQFQELYLAEIPRVDGKPDFPEIVEENDPETVGASIRILAARYDAGLLRVGFACNKKTEIVRCMVDGESLPFVMEGNGIIAIEAAQPPSRIILEGIFSGEMIRSPEGWVDVERELRSTARGRSLGEVIRREVQGNRWGIGAWNDILDAFYNYLKYMPTRSSQWGNTATERRTKQLASFTAQDVFSSDYGLPNLGSAVKAGLADDRIRSLQQMLLRYFSINELEKPTTDEDTPIDGGEDGEENVVDRPMKLPNSKEEAVYQSTKELDQKRAKKSVEQMAKAMTSEEFLLRRSPEQLADDLKFAAVLLRTGFKQSWMDEYDFFEATRLIWSSFFFSSPKEPNQGWIERRCQAAEDPNEFKLRMASPELSAALAAWSMTVPWDIKTPEHVAFFLSQILAVARLPWLWRGGETERIALESGLMLANTSGRLSDEELIRFEQGWISLMRRGEALRALEEALMSHSPVGLREKIREDQVLRGELLWQGSSGYCVAMTSCKRSSKENTPVLRLQGAKKESLFSPSFLIPMRCLLNSDVLPESDKWGILQKNSIRDILSEISKAFHERAADLKEMV
jgi:hypothetical protein